MKWKHNIRFSRKHLRRLPDGTTGKSSDTPSAFLRDQNPAAIVVEVIPLVDSKLNGGILRHDARFLVPERDRRLL